MTAPVKLAPDTGSLRIVPYCQAHADGARTLFIEINRELTPPGMEGPFAAYVERALAEEIDKIADYYDPRTGSGFWVMLHEDVVIGFVGLEHQTSEVVELRRLYLNKAYRGHGLADLLLTHAETEARSLSYGRLVLSTSEIQKSAIAFYRRRGFHEVRQEVVREQSHKAVGGGLLRLFFEKRLDRTTPRRERIVRWNDPVALSRHASKLSGRDFLLAVLDGDLPLPPICHLVGFSFEAIEDGRAVMTLIPQEAQYNPMGSVHGGVIATVLNSVMGCAVHTTLPKGRGYTTLEIKVNYLRAVDRDTGPMRAIGRVVHAGRRTAVAEGSLVDESGKLYAQSNTTCLIFDIPQAD